jgi:hypothetical protein
LGAHLERIPRHEPLKVTARLRSVLEVILTELVRRYAREQPLQLDGDMRLAFDAPILGGPILLLAIGE